MSAYKNKEDVSAIIKIAVVSGLSGFIKVVYPFLIRFFFGLEILGVYSVYFHTILLIALPVELGLAISALKFVSESLNSPSVYIWNSIAIFISYYILTFIFYFFIPVSPSVKPIIFLGILLFGFHLLLRHILWGMNLYDLAIKLELISFALGVLGFAIMNSYLKISPLMLLSFPIIFNVVYVSAVSYWLIRHVPFSPISRPVISRIVHHAIFLGIANILGFGLTYLQYVIASLWFTEKQVGTLTFWTVMVLPLSLISYPFSVRLINKLSSVRIKEKMMEGYQQSLSTINGVLLIVTGISFVFYFFNNGYVSSYEITILFVSILVAVLGFANTIASIYFLIEDVKYNTLSAILGAFLSIFTWIAFHSTFGILSFPIGLLANMIFVSVFFTLAFYHLERKVLVSNILLILSSLVPAYSIISGNPILANFSPIVLVIGGISILRWSNDIQQRVEDVS